MLKYETYKGVSRGFIRVQAIWAEPAVSRAKIIMQEVHVLKENARVQQWGMVIIFPVDNAS